MKSDVSCRCVPRCRKFLFAALFTLTALCPPGFVHEADAALRARESVSVEAATNPQPAADDILLPMPGGLQMAFRLVAVPAKGLLWDMPLRPGRDDAANNERAFYDRRYAAALAAPFTLDDLPADWRKAAPKGSHYFYLVAKYEVSRLQYDAVMQATPPDPANLAPDAARPVTDVSWYDAVDFTRRYTQWLLQNAPDSLPRYAGDSRNVGFVRLPTETEWEYAARGGQFAGTQQLMQEDFFVMADGTDYADYAVYRPEGAGRIEEDVNRIGSRKPNPLGLYDTAGNAAEMTLEPFRFSVAGRLHGSAGGMVRKGGSFLSGEAEIMPGRREETPFFMQDGPAHARDLGFRPVISGINTPGGDRPETLVAEWNRAGESASPLPEQDQQAGRNPLEELDRLLASAPNEGVRKNLLALRTTIKENNIMQERQKQLEAQSLLRTGLYLIETIRNYASRQQSLDSQLVLMKDDLKRSKGEMKQRLQKLITQSTEARKQYGTGIERTLSFYLGKLEEAGRLDAALFADSMEQLGKDFPGADVFNKNMRRNMEIFTRQTQEARRGKALDRRFILQQILAK